ncbi:hypothetical protein ACF0H5_007798 [Mactra antiquata]
MDQLRSPGRARDHEVESPVLEGEKMVMSKPGRQKRKGFVYESKLAGINETCERKANINTLNERKATKDGTKFQSILTNESVSQPDNTKAEINNNIEEMYHDVGIQTTNRGSYDGNNADKESPCNSPRSRRSSDGSDVRFSEAGGSVNSDSGRKNNFMKMDTECNSKFTGSSKNSEILENKQNPPVETEKAKGSSGSRENSIKQSDDKDKVIEAKRLLPDIVYPREYYDQYQRSGRRAKGDTNSKIVESPKVPIAICKPVKVGNKAVRRERSTFSFKPSVAEKLAITERTKHVQNESTDADQSPQKRIKTEREIVIKKEIHMQCKAKRNALVITDDSEGQKMVLKGLKGWIAKKEDIYGKHNHQKEIKHCMSSYQVNSLGIQFSLPEYSTTRVDKKHQIQSPRPFTCLETGRSYDIHQVIRRPVTGNYITPREILENSPEVDSVQIMSSNQPRLRRSYTNVPKLFADPVHVDATPSDLKSSREQKSRLSHKPLEKSVTFYDTKARVSLPPIGNDMKSRSLSLGQF